MQDFFKQYRSIQEKKMPVTNDNYDQLKIDKLKHFLEEMASKSLARPYEIFVDNLKVVPKTDDPKDFDNYEYYMNEDTEKIRILIYNSAHTPRNDQYCFYVQKNNADKPKSSLNGLGEIETIVQEKLSAKEKEYELQRLQKELEETKQQLEESEEYAEELEKQLEESKSNKYKLGKLDLADLGTVVLGKFVEKNADVLSKVGLSGLSAGKEIQENTNQGTEATFQKKSTETDSAGHPSTLNPDSLKYIPVLQNLDQTFEKEELEVVMRILQKFSEEPGQLKTVAELLNIQET
jgi:hypothetical protein